MAKEWILNCAMNRFQLNFKRNVGAVSEGIRKCTPKTVDEWKEYYFQNVRTKEHIEDLWTIGENIEHENTTRPRMNGIDYTM